MRADEAWARLKNSAFVRFLRSPKGPVTAALVVAVAAVLLYMAAGLNSCSDTGTVAKSSSLWSSGSASTDDDLARILSQIEGAGDTDALITYDKQGALVGVVVVSEGARDHDVCVKLMRAVATATGADIDQIEIFEKSK